MVMPYYLSFIVVIYQQKQVMCILEKHFMDGTVLNKQKKTFIQRYVFSCINTKCFLIIVIDFVLVMKKACC